MNRKDIKEMMKIGVYDYVINHENNMTKEDLGRIAKELDFAIYAAKKKSGVTSKEIFDTFFENMEDFIEDVRLAKFVGGDLDGLEIEVDQIENYGVIDGYSADLSSIREKGGLVHRKELDNQPQVKGYLGPMWDDGKLRYETQEVYNGLCQ